MTIMVCHSDPRYIDSLNVNKGVLLYGTQNQTKYRASIGNQVWNNMARLAAQVSQESFDFLTIALAVTAADVFISRETSPTGFSRQIKLMISVVRQDFWQDLKPELEKTLSFLSGDNWELSFLPGGKKAPTREERSNFRKLINISKSDCVSLFSGGLDSLIGALNLIAVDSHPLLVSRSSTGDQGHQQSLKSRLPMLSHLSINDSPRSDWPGEISKRTRSFLFLAIAGCASSAICNARNIDTVPLFIPENGFIAINPPLTMRRIGALSTRTSHPKFIRDIQLLFDASFIPANIINPLQFLTKGEAFSNCHNISLLDQIAHTTISCGKWMRRNMQCGRCIPCLIRRSAFHRRGITDLTRYQSVDDYGQEDLRTITQLGEKHQDLVSLINAIRRMRSEPMAKWVIKSGPLPIESEKRKKYFDVVERGLKEIENFLGSQNIEL